MACMDLAGKAWGVPCWQMLGGKFRDRVRLYADTTHGDDPKQQGERAQGADEPRHHVPEAGLRHRAARRQAGHAQRTGRATRALGRQPRRSIRSPASRSPTRASSYLSDWVGQVRDVIGMEIPLSSDHYGHFGVNSGIKLARAMEKWNLAWMEDILPWQYGELLKQIRDSTTVPVLTGEDIYLKEDFIKLIDMGAVDMIHPDLASSRRPDRDQEDRRLRDGARRGDGDALCRLADLVHGQRPLCRRDRELHRARASLARCAVVGEPGQDDGRQARSSKRDSRSCPTARVSASS